MTTRIMAASIVFLGCHAVGAQEPATPASSSRPRATLYDIGRAIPWAHIGAPPQGSPAARVEEWRRESAAYGKAFAVIKESWTGEAVENPDELRFKVGQYEDLIRTVTESGGYGNLVLADCLRKLSLSLLIRYAVTHPSEYAAVGDLLAKDRVRLLDCAAIGDMVAEELKLAPPSGKWHLSDGKEDLELIYRTDGSSSRNEGGRSLLHMPVASKLMSQRDISGLLHRLVGDEMIERVSLAGLVEFLKRGGSLTDLKTFDRVMGGQRARFQFPPLGIPALNVDYVDVLIEGIRKLDGKPVPFSALTEN